MTQPSQQKQILAKLDQIVEQQALLGKQVARLEKHIEMQPLIDIESHKAIDERSQRSEARITKLEEAQVWAMRLIIGNILSLLVALFLAFSKL